MSSSPNKLAEAVALFAEAAEAGSRSAMFNLGVAYFKGRGVDVDFDLAEHWFTKEGSAEASYSIAQMYVACHTCRGNLAHSPAFWSLEDLGHAMGCHVCRQLVLTVWGCPAATPFLLSLHFEILQV